VYAFVDISPKKIGKTRRELPIISMSQMLDIRSDELVLGAVAARGASQQLKQLFISHALIENQDFVMTC